MADNIVKMSCSWMKNYAGMKLTAQEYEDIPRPLMEFTLHVTFKTALMGNLVGSLAGPIASMVASENGFHSPNIADIKERTEKYGTIGAACGLVAGPLLTAMVYSKVAKGDKQRVYDWCFRTRYNPRQMRVDRLAIVGTLAGCGVAYALQDSPALGAVVGASGGMITAMLLNYVVKM